MTELLLDRLKGMVKRLDRDDLATVEALLVDLTGSRVAAQMLERLLLWWPKATNAGGWVYKSHDDWWAELRIKDSELTKAKGALEMAGVVIQRKQAAVKSDKTPTGWAAAPVRHYRLDIRRFLKRLATTLGLSILKLASLMKNPFRERSKIVSLNGHETITTSPQTTLQTDVVAQKALQEAVKISGLKQAAALRLISTYGASLVGQFAPHFQSDNWKNPAGAFCQALREHWQFGPVEMTQQVVSEAVPDRQDERLHDEPPPLPPSPAEPAAASPPAEAWNRALRQLEAQIDRHNFDTFLRPTHFERVEQGEYIIAAPHPFARDILQERMYRDIRRVLGNVLGAPVELRFEVMQMSVEQGGR